MRAKGKAQRLQLFTATPSPSKSMESRIFVDAGWQMRFGNLMNRFSPQLEAIASRFYNKKQRA
jgi:hypothetical protein